MENGAKNKAILLSPWGTTGQYLCKTAANFLRDYSFFLSGRIQANKISQGLSFAFNLGGLQTYTHLHIHPKLTHLLPN